MRTIGVVTGARSEYGIYLPILREIEQAEGLRLKLMVCGAHLVQEFGNTIDVIEADGFPIAARVETLMASDTPEGIAKSMAVGIMGFSQIFAQDPPNILLVLGDRYEMLAAAAAILPFALPIAHIHGGESTEGLIDEAVRHALTKMSHLHFVTTQHYADRVIRMGEQPDRVFVTGAPSLDHLRTIQFLDREELGKALGLNLEKRPIMVTFHPVTLDYDNTELHIAELLGALESLDRPIVLTYPGADTHGRIIVRAIDEFTETHENVIAATNLGTERYFSLMNQAAAMVGNSSSGIIEAASFRLPVVNVGDRQKGRVRARNVIDVACERSEIAVAIERAISPAFIDSLSDMTNPHGDGHSAERIVETLTRIEIGADVLRKPFYDPPGAQCG